MSKVNATVTLRIEYDTTDLEVSNKPDLVKQHLIALLNTLYADGALSGFNDMTIEDWDYQVSTIEICPVNDDD